MNNIDTRSERTRQALGLLGGLIGVAHFLVPRIFDPFNRLGFPNHARTFTYVNGAIETALGVLLLRADTRRPTAVLSACYITYLTISILRTQLRMRPSE
ncbi:DoxX-like family protein [Mycobacterium sp. E2699]|uniref:DoxX-like family protein n=1 Tax=Mycobacterium sp. E2699 TaxID=1834137 RepID=UPI0009ED5941|nr:DoxX-like family protein [Mycobacterium sp. E2699]